MFALLLTLLPACERAEPVPPLPGVPPGTHNWFWRDVLSTPLPGEAAPRSDVLALPTARERIDALGALVDAGDPTAFPTLMAALRDPSEAVAIVAAEELGLWGDVAAVPRLIKGLGPYPIEYDTSIALRVAEASALARLGTPAGVALLLQVLAEDTFFQVERADLQWPETDRLVFLRELALTGIEALAGQDFGYVPNASVPSREAAWSRLNAWWNERQVALWRNFDASSDEGLRTRLRLMVAHLGAYQLRQIDGARFTLARAGPSSLSLLREGLSSEDTYVRVHVLEIMELMARDVGGLDRKQRTRLAVTAAVPLMDDPEPTVSVQAARVCGAVAEVDPLVAALSRRTEPEVQLAVIDALGATGSPLAATTLRAWLAGDGRESPADLAPDLRAAVEAAWLRTDPQHPVDGFLALLASPDPDVAYPAVERLVAITGDDHGIDASAPPAERAAGLQSARETLLLDRP